jgi:hypothetical protein
MYFDFFFEGHTVHLRPSVTFDPQSRHSNRPGPEWLRLLNPWGKQSPITASSAGSAVGMGVVYEAEDLKLGTPRRPEVPY